MDLSIIIAVYNMERNNLLEKCMQSLVHQTCSDYEVIAVDDASTDRSLEILERYKSDYPNLVKVIHRNKNGKQGAARNDGIKAATGKWIGVVDADDVIRLDMYEKLIRIAEINDADCAGGRIQAIDLNDKKLEVERKWTLTETTRLTKEIKKQFFIKGERIVNKIFLRERIVKKGLWYPENIYFEDNAVGAYWFLECNKYAHCDDIMYYYRTNPISTINEMTYQKFRDRIKSCNILLQNGKKFGANIEYKDEIEFCYWRLLYVGTKDWCNVLSKEEKSKIHKMIQKGMRENIPYFWKNRYIKEFYSFRELILAYLFQFSLLIYNGLQLAKRVEKKIMIILKNIRKKR